MVFLPGRVLHLLDCSAEHEPCHHIILQGEHDLPLVSLMHGFEPQNMVLPFGTQLWAIAIYGEEESNVNGMTHTHDLTLTMTHSPWPVTFIHGP